MPVCLALSCTASQAEGSGDQREPVPGAVVRQAHQPIPDQVGNDGSYFDRLGIPFNSF